MSLKLDPIQPVPEGTVCVARAAFRRGNSLVKLRDELGTVFAGTDFADLFPRLRRPAKMNDLSGPNRTGCTAQIERAVR